MKLSDICKMFTDGGIPCRAWVWNTREHPENDLPIPYAVAAKARSGKRFSADNINYYPTMEVYLFLNIYPWDEDTEHTADEILNEHGIPFEYEMAYATEDEVCVKTYFFEVEES